jgi:hypothetical protein
MLLVSAPAFAGAGIDAAHEAVAKLDATTVAGFESAAPIQARNGSLRYFDEALAVDSAVPWLVTRIADAGEDRVERHAYAHALVRHLAEVEGDSVYKAAWLELASSVDDLDTRKQLVAGLAKADAATMTAGLTTALADADPSVRALAANTAALHPAGARLDTALFGALRDGDAAVRAQAIRSLGVLGVVRATTVAQRMTADADAEVRLWALRTLQRLDRELAVRVAAELTSDPDARVARFAGTLR